MKAIAKPGQNVICTETKAAEVVTHGWWDFANSPATQFDHFVCLETRCNSHYMKICMCIKKKLSFFFLARRSLSGVSQNYCILPSCAQFDSLFWTKLSTPCFASSSTQNNTFSVLRITLYSKITFPLTHTPLVHHSFFLSTSPFLRFSCP